MYKQALLFSSALLLFLPTQPVYSAGSGGGGGAVAPAPSRSQVSSPQQVSEKHYNTAFRQKEKAWKYEAKAAKATSDKSRDKNLAKAQKAYKKAVDGQTKALKAYASNYKAANELGYALRKTGDYEKAVGAYNYALQLNPNYYPAVEYRGEAFLALGYLDHAKQAYMHLFRSDRVLADELMTAIDSWLADEENTSTAANELAAWVDERKALAKVTQDLSSDSRSW